MPRDIFLRTTFYNDKGKKSVTYKTNDDVDITISKKSDGIAISIEGSYVLSSKEETKWLIHCLEGFI